MLDNGTPHEGFSSGRTVPEVNRRGDVVWEAL
jgi:hypothetical protein